MLVDMGSMWLEAGLIFAVRKPEEDDCAPEGTLSVLEVSGGEIYFSGYTVQTAGERIRTAQREMLAGGIS